MSRLRGQPHQPTEKPFLICRQASNEPYDHLYTKVLLEMVKVVIVTWWLFPLTLVYQGPPSYLSYSHRDHREQVSGYLDLIYKLGMNNWIAVEVTKILPVWKMASKFLLNNSTLFKFCASMEMRKKYIAGLFQHFYFTRSWVPLKGKYFIAFSGLYSPWFIIVLLFDGCHRSSESIVLLSCQLLICRIQI